MAENLADGIAGDFLLLAEFSEIHGPVPLLTYPHGAGATFDKNAFTLRVMAVDFQKKADRPSLGMVTQDVQLVLRDRAQAAYAFVHHFSLPDFHARGYVRAVCLAYVTPHAQKLMPLFDDLKADCAQVALLLKTAAQQTFLRDIDDIVAELHALQKYGCIGVLLIVDHQQRERGRGYL